MMSYGLFSPCFCLSFKKKSYHIILKFKKNIVWCPKLPCVRSSSTGILLGAAGGGGQAGGGAGVVYCLGADHFIRMHCLCWAWLLFGCLLDPKPFPDTKKRTVLWACGEWLDFYCRSVSLGFTLFFSYTYCFCRQEGEAPRCGSLGTGSNCCPWGRIAHCT